MFAKINTVKWPLLILLLAHSVFSLGIWNAREGYWEDTENIRAAWDALQHRPAPISFYAYTLAVFMKVANKDPVAAVTFIKYLSSLLATVAIFLALASFRDHLRPSAILVACLVWIACSLDAPYLQSTSLGLFAFAIMLLGFDFLLWSDSAWSRLGFFAFAGVASLMRPEYYLAVAFVGGGMLWRSAPRIKVCFLILVGITALALLIKPSAWETRYFKHLDKYVFLGFRQCYADYYVRTHPKEMVSSMTENKPIIDRTFGQPKGFSDALRTNPGEVGRYFFFNGARNIGHMPLALFGDFRERSYDNYGPLFWAMLALLVVGIILGVRRLLRTRPALDSATKERLTLLLIMASTSIVAILLLIPTPRYFLPWAPLYYVGLAFCVDSILEAVNRPQLEKWAVLGFGLWLCAPNYLQPRPDLEYRAVARAAQFVETNPAVGGWWDLPDIVFGLDGHGRELDVYSGLTADDIKAGRVDILLIDQNFRGTRLWSENRAFFEEFTNQPNLNGFTRMTNVGAWELDVFYRPKPELTSLKTEPSTGNASVGVESTGKK